MAANVEFRPFFLEDVSHFGHVMTGIASDMGHIHMHVFHLKKQVFRILKAYDVVVDVAMNRAERLESLKLLRGLNVSNVAGMPDLIHILEEVKDLWDDGPMGVGQHTDSLHFESLIIN